MPSKKRLSHGDFFLEDIHNYRINREHFTIYIGGDPVHQGNGFNEGLEPGVDYSMADRFELNLDVLSSIDPTKPILINMASCGGYMDAGMQMFSAILTCPNPITVLATKHARSMTSLIPLPADKFVIRPPATYMYHRGSYGIYSLDEEVETEDYERRKSHELMMRIYVSRLKEQGKFSHMQERQIRSMLDNSLRKKINVYLTADEAVEWGFADDVFDGNLDTLRTTTINHERRQALMGVLRKSVTIDVKVS